MADEKNTENSEGSIPDKGAEAPAGSKGEGANLDFILDIPLELSVELGKTKMLVNDLLQLVLVAVSPQLDTCTVYAAELLAAAGDDIRSDVGQLAIEFGDLILVVRQILVLQVVDIR